MLYKLAADWGPFKKGSLVGFRTNGKEYTVYAFHIGSTESTSHTSDVAPELDEVESTDMAPHFNNIPVPKLVEASDGTIYYTQTYIASTRQMMALKLDFQSSMWTEPVQVDPFTLRPISPEELSEDNQSHLLVANFYGIKG